MAMMAVLVGSLHQRAFSAKLRRAEGNHAGKASMGRDPSTTCHSLLVGGRGQITKKNVSFFEVGCIIDPVCRSVVILIRNPIEVYRLRLTYGSRGRGGGNDVGVFPNGGPEEFDLIDGPLPEIVVILYKE